MKASIRAISVVMALASAFILVLGLSSTRAEATVAFEQPPDPAGGVLLSSWWFPDGSDYDQFAYDSFQLASTQAITEVRWRGGYAYAGWGLVNNFSVSFYASIAGGSQPLCGLPGGGDLSLVQYEVGDNAGETLVGDVAGISMYDYHFVLPQPFAATAGVKYWVRITAYTPSLPFWGLAVGTGGNNQHFRYIRGASQFSFGTHDAAFSLHTTAGSTWQVTTSATPAGSGTTTGDAPYPQGATVSVIATPAAGWGFVNWTENGSQVSTASTYTFTVNSDRNLVAHFSQAYTVTTAPQPAIGGTTSGDGVYIAGSTVTVSATPGSAWQFVNWTESGTPVSSTPTYAFTASANRTLVANFVPVASTVLFDFDAAPLYTSLPLNQTVGGLTAHLSATGGGFSIQNANAIGFTPDGFSGRCLYPNGPVPELLVSFTIPLTGFSIMYCPQELGCDDSATMRVTAYYNGVLVGTNTATAPVPGTWPTGTLSFNSAQPFNSVVVRYDAPPPNCQDYGAIYLADNMIATMVQESTVGDPAMLPSFTPAISPNPSRGETTIRLGLANAGPVSVTMHDVQGRLVRTLLSAPRQDAGDLSIGWDGRDDGGRPVASGVYLCRVVADGRVASRRMVMVQGR